MSSSSSSSSGGIGFFGLLTILFIGLKLTDTIDWSWVWVLAPLWIPLAIVLFVIVLICISWFAHEVVKDRRRKRKQYEEPMFPTYIKVVFGLFIVVVGYLIFLA